MTNTPPPCAADPERWYDPALVASAKRTCSTCPAQGNCLTLAIEFSEPWGAWGGLTENERQRYIDGRPITQCTGCGLDFVASANDATQCEGCTSEGERADVEEVARLAADGWTDKQIGAHKGWHHWRVRDLRHHNDIPSRHVVRRGTRALTNPDLKPCGTSAAHRRHLRRNEPVDAACRAAEALRAAMAKEARRALRSKVPT